MESLPAPTLSSLPSIFAVREKSGRIPGYAIRHPATGFIVSNRSFESAYCEKVLTMPEAEATRLAAALTVRTGVKWVKELAPNPCPKCQRVISADDGDFCYPSNRQLTQWRAGCNEHDFGCGHEVKAESYTQVMALWNGTPT